MSVALIKMYIHFM